MAESNSSPAVKKVSVSEWLNTFVRKNESKTPTNRGSNTEECYERTLQNETESTDDSEFEISDILPLALKHLMEKNFKNFKFTLHNYRNEAKNDLMFICGAREKQKISIAQLRYKSQCGKISFKNLTQDDGSGFYLERFFDLLRDLEDYQYIEDDCEYSDVGEILVCTNVDLDDNLQHFSKVCLEEDGFKKYYKLTVKELELKKSLFPSQYVSDQENLARELVYCVMTGSLVHLSSGRPCRFMKKYENFLLENVLSSGTHKFSDLFLSENLKFLDLNLYKFRKIFVKELNKFCSNLDNIGSRTDYNKFELEEETLTYLNTRIDDVFNKMSVLEFLRYSTIDFVRNVFNKNDKKIKIHLPKSVDYSRVNSEIDRLLNSITFMVVNKERSSSDERPNWNYHKFLKRELQSIRKGMWISKDSLVNKILDIPVCFMGKNEHLNRVINIQTLDDPKLLSEAFDREIPSHIGTSATTESKFYIPRKLKKLMIVDLNILKENKTDIFIISLTEGEVEYFQTHYIDKRESFLSLMDKIVEPYRLFYTHVKYDYNCFPFLKNEFNNIRDSDAHFLTYENGDLKWEHTIGNVSNIQSYFIDSEDDYCVNELDCLDASRFIIINGRSGLGKSALLTYVANKLRVEQELNIKVMWIVHIDLATCGKHMNKKFTRDKKGLSDVYKYIYECENIQEEFSRIVFHHFLSDSRVVMLFDGFEELPECSQDNIIELFECLKYYSNVKQIWITSPPGLVSRLEHCFEVSSSYELKQLEMQEQITLLVEFWKKSAKSFNDEILFSNASNLVRGVRIPRIDNLTLGIPLHLFMLAFVYENEACLKTPCFPATLTLYELFEKYFSKEMCRLDVETGKLELEDSKSYSKLVCEEFAKWQNEVILSDLKSIIEKAGEEFKKSIILKLQFLLNFKESDIFAHHSFQEYFLGKFLALCVQHVNNDELTLSIIRNILLKMKNQFILYIFDMALSYNETYNVFQDIMNSNTENMNDWTERDLLKADLLGRGALYYALHYRSLNALKILINKNISLSYEPFFLAFFEEWYSENDGRHLSYFKHKSIGSLERMDQFNELYKEITIYILMTTNQETCPQILKSYVDLFRECELKHWEIIKLWIEKFDYKLESVLQLDNLLRKVKNFNCPPEILMLIVFRAIDTSNFNKRDQVKIKSRTSRILGYEGTDEFLFGCEENFLIMFLKRCEVAKADIVRLFFKKLSTNYFKDVRPFFIEYNNAKFSDYVGKIKKRSVNFTIMVKHFLTNGIKTFPYDIQSLRSFLMERWTIHFPRNSDDDHDTYFQERLKNTELKNIKELEWTSQLEKDDMIKVLQEYRPIVENKTIHEALTAIVIHILETGGGVKLLNLTYNFQNALLDRDLPKVKKYLNEGRKLGFLEVISEATYEFGDNPEQMLDDFAEHVRKKVSEMIEDIDSCLI